MEPKATGTLAFGNFLRVAGTRYKDREAIFCSTTGRRFSYGDLNQRTNGLANGLTDLGLSLHQPGRDSRNLFCFSQDRHCRHPSELPTQP